MPFFQIMTPSEKYLFCKDGKIVSVECRSTDNQPYYSTGEIVSCNVDQGLVCENADNFPACQHDYMIRYQCEETTCQGISRFVLNETSRKNQQLGFPTRSDANQAMHP